MPTAAKAKRKTIKRPPLSAAAIAEAALKLIDTEGLDGFSYRTLAQRLGCEAMSIYHYYPSKLHLFDALVDICIRETPRPEEPAFWLDRLRILCHRFRATAQRHPGFFLYFTIHRLNHRAGLAFLNGILSIIEESGLSAHERAIHFRSIGYYVMGAGLDESLGYANGPSAAEPMPDEEARKEFPAIMSVGPFFSQAYRTETFEAGLEPLLANLLNAAQKIT